MKNLVHLVTLFFCLQICAEENWIGTIEKPVPLNSMTNTIPYAIYLYDNHFYQILHQSEMILSGTWTQSENSVTLGRDGFANKMYLNSNGQSQICLQGVFYRGPQEFQSRGEVFCAFGKSLIPL